MAWWRSPVHVAALSSLASFAYVSQSLERHSLTERPRLSSELILLLASGICFAGSHFSHWLPGASGRFDAAQQAARPGLLSGAERDGIFPKGPGSGSGQGSQMPNRPRRLSLPMLICCIVVRLEIFHRVNSQQQCSTPGIESFLCLLLFAYEIFQTRRQWGFPPPEDPDDPWRSAFDDFYDWFSGPRVTMTMVVMSAFLFSLGTFLAVGNKTRSTYFCFNLVDSRFGILSLQILGLGLDAAIIVLLWRILAWSRTTKARLHTLGIVLGISSLALCVASLLTGILSRSRRFEVAFGSLYGFDIIVDSIAFASLLMSSTYWLCESSPIIPASATTILVGLWSCVDNVLRLGDWLHNSKSEALTPLYIISLATIWFMYCNDIRRILFLRRMAITLLLLVLLLAATIFTIIRPLQTFGRHPINDRIYRAHVEHDRWLIRATVSQSSAVAINTYVERHRGKRPPPGFAIWYDYAAASKVIDEFPQIDRDLAPFWKISPKSLRERAEIMAAYPNVASIWIKGGNVTSSPTGNEEQDRILKGLVTMIEKFSAHLPDMVLPINTSPTPRIIPSWEAAQSIRRAELSSVVGLMSRKKESPSDENSGSDGDSSILPAWQTTSAADFRRMQIEACPPGSQSRINPHWSISEFCSTCIRPFSKGPILTKWDNSLKTCAQPDLQYLHGFFMTNPRMPPIRELLPLFGPSKTDGFNDIIIPLPEVEREVDVPWQFERRYDTLFWRGSVGEHAIEPLALRGSHKMRLLHLVDHSNAPERVSIILPVPNKRNTFGHEWVSANEASIMVPFNLGIGNFSACRGENCDLIRAAYGDHPQGQEPLEYRYVLLLDEDDGPPQDVMRTIQSGSVPFLSTIFRTWYTERLMPWLHFVPIDPRYQALHTTFTYFTGTDSRPKVNGRDTNMNGRSEDAEWIAKQGQRWAQEALGQKDKEVYLFRLLLEWGRLIDDARDDIGTWRDEKGGIREASWSQPRAPS